MQFKYHILDVFTEQRFAGNPLAVVRDAGGLSAEMMQKIARELNLSETVFVLPSLRPAHSARLRIFTPAQELPFAGHPTVGAAVLLGELRSEDLASDQEGDQDGLIVLELTAGTVRVGVRMRAGQASYAEFDAPRLPVEAGALPPIETLAAALSLIPSEIGFENHRPACFASGPAFAFIPVSTLEALARAAVDQKHWAAAFREQGLAGAYLYTRSAGATAPVFHARMFAPDLGVPEDPATGAAAVCLAGALCHFDKLPDGTHKRVIEQGAHMDRPSLIYLTIVMEAGKLVTVRIGGHAVRIAEGLISV